MDTGIDTGPIRDTDSQVILQNIAAVCIAEEIKAREVATYCMGSKKKLFALQPCLLCTGECRDTLAAGKNLLHVCTGKQMLQGQTCLK